MTLNKNFTLLIFWVSGITCNAQLPREQLLWPDGIPGNPFQYKEEKVGEPIVFTAKQYTGENQ